MSETDKNKKKKPADLTTQDNHAGSEELDEVTTKDNHAGSEPVTFTPQDNHAGSEEA